MRESSIRPPLVSEPGFRPLNGALVRHSLIPGATAAVAACATVAWRGYRDTGSAIAPINATSHVLWGEDAGRADAADLRHSLPGLMINLGAGLWWALVFEALFGPAVRRRGAPTALAAGMATAAMAYVLDYKILPRRLSPGWESRISKRSLFMGLGALGAGLAVGALLDRAVRR